MMNKYILLLLSISLIACNSDDTPVTLDEILNLEVLDSDYNKIAESLGDGFQTIILKASIPKNHKSEYNQIYFQTSDGEFIGIENSGNMRTTDENGNAFIYLTVPNKEKNIFFSAEISAGETTFTREKSIYLKRAYADSILFYPSAVKIKKGESLEFEVYLLRNIGKVSEGTAAYFNAFHESNGEPAGRFTGTMEKSDSEGKLTATFHTDTWDFDSQENDTISINIKTLKDSGDMISESTRIIVEAD